MDLIDKNTNEWIGYWASCYKYPMANFYEFNIGKPLSRNSVIELFTWKNRGRMSSRKSASVEVNYISDLGNAPRLASMKDGQAYLSRLGGGPIWGIFWLHCLNPALFPIFDQHTYRAMRVIVTGAPAELPAYNATKIRIYFEEYLPFLARFADKDSRSVDKALFAFGKSKKIQNPRVKA